MKRLFQCLGIVLLLAAASCDKAGNGGVKVTRISLSETEVVLRKGDVRSLTVTLAPSDATDQTVVWTSSNSNVVSVRDGLLTAVEVGSANVHATTADGRKRASCSVTVISEYIPVESVMIMDEDGVNSLNGSVIGMVEGDTYVAVAAVRPGDATNQNVSWTSSNPLVATVRNGTIKAVSAGSSTLTVTTDAGGKTASCTISVQGYVPPVDVTGVTLDRTSLTMNSPGQSVKLTATVTPADATTKDVRWSSSKPEVASVSNDGTVTAVSPGKAVITVRTVDQGKTATCQVDVKGYVTGVSLSPTLLNLSVGNVRTLVATVLPADALNKSVTWSSSKPEVASVDGDGKVTALASGMTTVTVTTQDGGYTASCTIIIVESTGDVNGGYEEFNESHFPW